MVVDNEEQGRDIIGLEQQMACASIKGRWFPQPSTSLDHPELEYKVRLSPANVPH